MLLVGFTGYQALKAKTALEQVAADFDTLSDQLKTGDQDAAEQTLTDAQRHAADAADNTDGPGWWLSSRIPQVGPNVRAVQTVAQISDRLASDVLPDVVSASGSLTPSALRPVKGRINLEPIRASAPAVERASGRLSAQADLAQGIDVGELAPQIAQPVEQLQTKITQADTLADRASRAVQLLPSMLGGDGKRTYLFMFQNNAEIRATGGIPGAFAAMRVNDGRISLGRQDDAGSLGRFEKPPVPLTKDEKAVFGEGLGAYPQDVNFTPDFPRSGELIAGMYKARGGPAVDGVLSVDPVALSYVLGGTGPLKTAGDQTLSADNAVRLLLSKVYEDIPAPDQQNDFFNAAARTVFDAVASGTGDPRVVLDGVVRAASERRLLVWSAHRDEQRLLASTALGGGLPRSPTKHPAVGVYFNAAAPDKLDYYLDYTTSVEPTSAGRNLPSEVTMPSRAKRSMGSVISSTFGLVSVLNQPLSSRMRLP